MDESNSGEALTPVNGADQRIGSYRVIHPVGTGGMSSVFRAVHVETGNEVALKVLTRTLARNSTLLQRFLREARSAETLQHPNIVMIFDRGIDRGRHYLVLEYVPGGDFHEYVQRRGPLDAAEAVSVVKSVALGLKYAAGQGLIHRDIKPSNILRTPGGQVKIIDLGLALQNEFEDERVTREGTTVGTVDYMAPEQARDSRATSVQSDIYSLGCTFHYLLTGVAAYPGGDITDKLTRHARSAIPNVRDLRPEVPIAIGDIIQRMMAKRPEDRFASYDDLLAALDAAAPYGPDETSAMSTIPLADLPEGGPPSVAIDPWPSGETREFATASAGSASLPAASLADLASSLADESPERPPARSLVSEGPKPVLRRGTLDIDLLEPDPVESTELAPIASPPASSTFGWIVSAALIGLAVILLVIGLVQYMDTTSPSAGSAASLAEPDADLERPVALASRPGHAAVATRGRPTDREHRRLLDGGRPAAHPAEPKWVEPADTESPQIDARAINADAGLQILPDWARVPVPDHVDGPRVTVRRVAESSETFTVPSLQMALDRYIGGTIELADEGPLYNDDFRVAGETRLIRARPGCRAIVRVERSSSLTVRRQPAVFVLDRQNLTLDGIDLVVDVRDLSPDQNALFSCAGANLVLRNCTITVLNDSKASFTVFRVEASPLRATRIRLERTFVRGRFAGCVNLAKGSAALVLYRSLLLGGPGPLFRVSDGGSTDERQVFLGSSVVACPGPIIEWTRSDSGPRARTLLIRASGSVFGRLHGVGVASVIWSSSSDEPAAQQVDWHGDGNLFAGWKGLFASGSDPMIRVADLASARSTWNQAEMTSQEILLPWPHPPELASTTLAELVPFVPSREILLRQVAQPRSGLFEKAISEYPSPDSPRPVCWALERTSFKQRSSIPVNNAGAQAAADSGRGPALPPPSRRATTVATPTAGPELIFDTQAAPWNGDLGAFLRDRLPPDLHHVRVLVIGSGSHTFTPVRLPDGLFLEIRVEPLAASEPPSWSPEPSATGRAMIELRGGALVLANLVLRCQGASPLESLILVDQGHLVLSRCQLIAAGMPGDVTGDLIAFRSPSTQPFQGGPGSQLFSSGVDRPICHLDGSVLITVGTALSAEVGRGLVALTQCAVAAGIDAVKLSPAAVSRHRFDAALVLEHCTMTSERSIIRIGRWNGLAPGPDSPWLISSTNCAFLAMYDRKARETVLLRADAEALERGVVSWQAKDDAVDVDFFTAVGEGLPVLYRSRDLQSQWIHFWGNNHMSGRLTGPHGTGTAASVRFFDKLHPGRIEPVDLVLNPDHHPDRETLNVGADLTRLGIAVRPVRSPRPPF
jgi:serine/threonine protein kinase